MTRLQTFSDSRVGLRQALNTGINMVMPRYEGVEIDIGGPLRASDIEMKAAEDQAFNAQYGNPIHLTPMEAWQLYGVMSAERYVGLMKAALALERSGRSFEEIFDSDDPAAALNDAIHRHVPESEHEVIAQVAKAAEDYYMANQSRRIADRAKDALNSLRLRDMPFGLVTSVYTADAVRWADEMFPGYFDPDFVFGVEPDTPRGYDPKPMQLKTSALRMGIEPRSLLYVGDTRGDMKASQEAECAIALIRNGMTPPALFRKYLQEMPYFREGVNFHEVDDLYDAVANVVLRV